MKTKVYLVLFITLFASCRRCNQIEAFDLVSVFRFVNFSPADIDTVYFISCKPGQFVQVDLKSHTDKSQRYINQANESLFDIAANGMPTNSEMHIFASDTNLHFIVKPISGIEKGNACNPYIYTDSVSVNNIPQFRTKEIIIRK